MMGKNPSWFSRAGGGKARVRGVDARQLPVEQVSWDMADEFCRKLSARASEQSAGRVYRLPTEAQWATAMTKLRCRNTPRSAGTRMEGRGRVGRGGPTPGACSTCTATFGSGAGIGTGRMSPDPPMIQSDLLLVMLVCCVAARSSTSRPSCVRRAATPSSRGTVSTTSVSAWRGVTPEPLFHFTPYRAAKRQKFTFEFSAVDRESGRVGTAHHSPGGSARQPRSTIVRFAGLPAPQCAGTVAGHRRHHAPRDETVSRGA